MDDKTEALISRNRVLREQAKAAAASIQRAKVTSRFVINNAQITLDRIRQQHHARMGGSANLNAGWLG
jgi:hypothetical protein